LDKLLDKLRGRFIVFDGPDGCGKTTHRDLLARSLEEAGVGCLRCHDPGGTEISDRIRSVLLDYDLTRMNVNCEALLFMASRAQLITEVIEPAMAGGNAVLCTRFVSSTCAYQGAAGYDPRRVVELAPFAIGSCWPHATIVLDVDIEEGFERIGRRPHHAGRHRRKFSGQPSLFGQAEAGSTPDAMEARPIEYHRKVRQMFLELPNYYPAAVRCVDGRGAVEVVQQRVREALADVLG
jgi:dTMP kinase